MDSNWIEKEIYSLERIKKCKNVKGRSVVLIKFFLMLLAVFFYSTQINAIPMFKAMDGGQHFVCNKCRTSQWQDSSNANWAGKYHCKACGNQLN